MIELQLLPSRSGKSSEEAIHVGRRFRANILEGFRYDARSSIGERHSSLVAIHVKGEEVGSMLPAEDGRDVVFKAA